MVRHWAISVLRQYCRIYYTTVVVNFARFSENSAKMGPGVVIYLHIIICLCQRYVPGRPLHPASSDEDGKPEVIHGQGFLIWHIQTDP